ncbi:hypothetical protein PQX77_009134 [Marasmius sp. AFHP31]|nr:hypothetical protein PQX77_009134 [Marasmius sp. AFHP31]
MSLMRGDLDCKLPFELVEHILGECDHKSLLSCSLVCRPWIRSCRSRTFQKLQIEGGSEEQCLEIVSLVESQHSTIPEYIQEIRLDLKYGDLPKNEATNPLEFILMHLKDRVSSLRKLYLAYDGLGLLSCLSPELGSLARQIISSLGHIVELEIHLIGEYDARVLIQFTSAFPQLEVLKMYSGCNYQIPGEDFEKMNLWGFALSPSLGTLELGGGDDDVVIRGLPLYYHWLNSTTPLHLLNLSVHKVEIDTRDQIGRLDPNIVPFLCRCAGLRFLHLGFDTGQISGSGIAFYDLSGVRYLERLAVSIRNIVEDNYDLMVLDSVRRMLFTVSSPRLHTIALNVSGSGFRVLQESWDAIDALLATTKFTAVQVELIIPFSDITLRDGTSEEDLLIARKVFSRCNEREQLSAVRAPFTVKTRVYDGSEDPRDFQDFDEIEWVCDRFRLSV